MPKSLNSLLIHDLSDVDLVPGELHLAVGMFDGVHLGHQAVIESAIHSAQRVSGHAGVLTFFPHPSQVLGAPEPTQLIMTPAHKLARFRRLGVEYPLQLVFTKELASLSAEDFLPFLKAKLPHLAAIYVGDNFRFGAGRRGDIALLVELGKKEGIHVCSVDRVCYDGEPISSTRIRKLLRSGAVEEANTLLGYNYFTEGLVSAGSARGRELGFPTLNFKWESDLQPRYGVYVVVVHSSEENKPLCGVANFGVRPTFTDDTDPILEIHLFESGAINEEKSLLVEWLNFLRPEQKFPSKEVLQDQIKQDCERALSIWNNQENRQK